MLDNLKDYYTVCSNYAEVNSEQRKESARKEIGKWSEDSAKYLKYRQEWNDSANRDHLPVHPLHVDIELSDACNLRCKMCKHGIEKMSNVGFMDKELACRLIDECADIGVYSLKFNWRGEACLNEFLPEASRYAKSREILEVQINTNGLPQDKDMFILCARNCSGLSQSSCPC